MKKIVNIVVFLVCTNQLLFDSIFYLIRMIKTLDIIIYTKGKIIALGIIEIVK